MAYMPGLRLFAALHTWRGPIECHFPSGVDGAITDGSRQEGISRPLRFPGYDIGVMYGLLR